MCFQGVWFMAKTATGPWEVTSTVPKQIYEIPASSPSHNVTYVTVEDDDDNDDWVTFATVAGYTGVMVAYGCAVWGTGYYYPPYYGFYGGYPYYYPFYPTYGYGAYYNPWTGAYGRSAVAYGPYGGAGVSARYNPRTGTYSRGAAAWGPGGGRAYGQAYNPRTGAYGATRQGAGVYGSWGSTGVQRGDDWARTARVTNNVTGNTTRVTQGSGGGEAISRRGGVGRQHHGGPHRERRRVRRPRRQRLSQERRFLAEVRQRRLERHQSSAADPGAARCRPAACGRPAAQLADDEPAGSRRGRSNPGLAAHPRLRQLPEQRRLAHRGQHLPTERRPRLRRRWHARRRRRRRR